jgi:hypothetical protein
MPGMWEFRLLETRNQRRGISSGVNHPRAIPARLMPMRSWPVIVGNLVPMATRTRRVISRSAFHRQASIASNTWLASKSKMSLANPTNGMESFFFWLLSKFGDHAPWRSVSNGTSGAEQPFEVHVCLAEAAAPRPRSAWRPGPGHCEDRLGEGERPLFLRARRSQASLRDVAPYPPSPC